MAIEMLESVFLSLFTLTLIGCVAAKLPILYALIVGYLIFSVYARLRQYSVPAILKMSAAGIRTAKNVLMTFVLIGMLTALWRAAGTIPTIVCHAADYIRPSVFLLMSFLLNCLVSFLTGTAFGTAATMGVICMTMARTMGVDPVWAGGAVLSGAYFGDRCSPISTSALLISELTGTNIFQNIRGMTRTAALPFLMSCAIYAAIGVSSAPSGSGSPAQVQQTLSPAFRLGLLTLLPALLILVLSVLHLNIRLTMLSSIGAALFICLFYQKMDALSVLRLLVAGYHSSDPQVAALMDGGGILSMVNVAAIVTISSSYAGIFRETGLLDGLKGKIGVLRRRYSLYTVVFWASIAANVIICSQTAAIMLVHQTCGFPEDDGPTLAIALEDTVVVIAPLIPWSIAGTVPLASASAPIGSLLTSCYLYLIPLWGLFAQSYRRKQALRAVRPH